MSGFWEHRPILVTGAGGFIASHLIEYLVELGARVRAFVRYNSRGDPGLLAHLPAETLNRVEIFAGDLEDLSAVQTATAGMTVVFHLGALISIPYSYRRPAQVVRTNVVGTLNVLLASREARVQRLIHTSTSEVYGTAMQTPINESHPLQAQSPYAASKIGADKLAESFYRSFDLPVVTVRPFNTFGPRQSARAVIPTIITQALTQEKLHLGNLEARRDLTYVSDTITGFLRAAETPGIEGETFNLGTGNQVRIADLAETILAQVGRKIPIEVDPSRLRPKKSEVQILVSDYQLAQQRLGWSPQVSLEIGLKRTIDWIRDHLDFYQPKEYQV